MPLIKGLDTDQLRLTTQQQQRYNKNKRLHMSNSLFFKDVHLQLRHLKRTRADLTQIHWLLTIETVTFKIADIQGQKIWTTSGPDMIHTYWLRKLTALNCCRVVCIIKLLPADCPIRRLDSAKTSNNLPVHNIETYGDNKLMCKAQIGNGNNRKAKKNIFYWVLSQDPRSRQTTVRT